MRAVCWILLLWAAVPVILAPRAQAQTPSVIGRIERLDPALDRWIPADAEIEVLAGGFTWTEGPVWVEHKRIGERDRPGAQRARADGQRNQADGQPSDAPGGYLLFSDIPRNSIFRWTPGQGIDLFMTPSGYTGVAYYGLEPGSNGLALDPEGRLCACEHGDRRVSVLTRGGGKRTLVDSYQGKRLNSPNDLVFHSSGALFFTDPPYGLPERAEDPRRELDFCGVYRLDPDGQLTLASKQLDRPNGIGLSPDEKTLYVAQSDPAKPIWMAFPVREDLTLGEGRQLFSAEKYMDQFPGLPDGMAVADDGTIFGSGPGGIYVISPKGKLLGRLITGGRTSNCAFGPDGKTLYITADSHLCRVRLK